MGRPKKSFTAFAAKGNPVEFSSRAFVCSAGRNISYPAFDYWWLHSPSPDITQTLKPDLLRVISG